MSMDVSIFRVKEAGSGRRSFPIASLFLGAVGARCNVKEGEGRLLKAEPQAWRQWGSSRWTNRRTDGQSDAGDHDAAVASAARVQRAAQAGCSVADLLWGFAGQVQWKNCSTRGLRHLWEMRRAQTGAAWWVGKDREWGTRGPHELEEQVGLDEDVSGEGQRSWGALGGAWVVEGPWVPGLQEIQGCKTNDPASLVLI